MINNLKVFVKPFIIAFLACLITGACQSPDSKTAATKNPLFNKEIVSEEGEPILVGKLNREAWQKNTYRDWFASEYQAYEVDEMPLQDIKAFTNSLEILVFLGTWCSDSRREVPRLYKVLDYLEFDDNRLRVVALDNHPDRYKQSPQQEEVDWNIEFVPTIIILREEKEIGRIVETPVESLERDLAKML